MEYNANVFEYKSFLAEQIIEQAKMNRYIQECVLMSESKNTIKNMNILNESVTDKIKEAFKKIMEAIGRMWGKFIEAVTNLVNGNRSYLEKYKDIILKKKLDPNVTYTMFDYETGLKNMMSVAVPIFNYATMQSQLTDADVFGTAYFKQIPKSDAAFADRCKAYFRGNADPIQIPSSKINMTDIFNYCYNYESKMKPMLEKDLKEIKNASNNVASIIDKAERERNSQPAATPDSNSADEAHKNESFDIYGNKKYYSYVHEEYITELEINHGTEPNAAGSENNASANMKNVQGEAPNKDDQAKAVKSDESSYDDQIKKAQTYLNVSGGLLGAKQTISEEIFKEYMQIIKAHVRSNVGAPAKDTSNDKVADAGTNYKNIVDKAFDGKVKPEDEAKKK